MTARRTTRVHPAIVATLLLAIPFLLAQRRPTGAGSPPVEPRFLSVVGAGSESASFVTDATRTNTLSFDSLGAAFSPFGKVRWRGDRDSYLDVYFETPIMNAGAGVFGAEFAPMVRYEWTGTTSSPAVELDPMMDAISLGIPFTKDGPSQPRALRVYDRGACSGEARWRELADRIFPEMDERVDFVLGGDEETDFCFDNTGDGVEETCLCGAMPSGNWTVTPRLMEDLFGHPLDTFRLFRAYTVHLCGGGWVGPLRVAITGAFGAASGHLVYRGQAITVEFDGSPVAGFEDLLTEFEDTLNAEIPAAVGTVPRNGTGAPLFPCTLGSGGDTQCFMSFDGISALLGLTPGALQPRNAVCVPEGSQGGACALVPNVIRVNPRPEGIELVLSEWAPKDVLTGECTATCDGVTCPEVGDPITDTVCVSGSCVSPACAADPLLCSDAPICVADALFPVLDSSGACDRESLPTATTGGYMGSVFEIPPVGTPLPYRDAP